MIDWLSTFNGLLFICYLGHVKKKWKPRLWAAGPFVAVFFGFGCSPWRLGANAAPATGGLSCELLPSTTRQFFGLFLGWLLGA
jgi:hypothetical protein